MGMLGVSERHKKRPVTGVAQAMPVTGPWLQGVVCLYDNSIPIDIVPFGAISSTEGDIRWPPTQDEVMNVVGIEDAFKFAQSVRLREEPPLDINFSSPLGLAVMKLIAWNDRNAAGNKDAIDLATVLRTYLDAGNRERLYSDHADLLTEDFDYVLAGAELLGLWYCW